MEVMEDRNVLDDAKADTKYLQKFLCQVNKRGEPAELEDSFLLYTSKKWAVLPRFYPGVK